MTEKHRMYVFRNMEPEEPVLSSGYLRRFTDLTISSVLLDDVFEQPEQPALAATHTVEHEIRSLRDARTLLASNSLRDCLSFVERGRRKATPAALLKTKSAAAFPILCWLAERSPLNSSSVQAPHTKRTLSILACSLALSSPPSMRSSAKHIEHMQPLCGPHWPSHRVQPLQ